MPYFVVVRSRVKPSIIKAGDAHQIHTEVLPDAYTTLEAAELAAQQRAEREQEWPWTSVYLVEAPTRRRAARLPDPNGKERERAESELLQGAFRDPEGRVPKLPERRSAFQPPRVPPEPPAPTLLPPASFTEPVVHAALEALSTAGFAVIPRGRSAYFEGHPQYAATLAARARAAAAVQREVQNLGGLAALSREQQQWLAELNRRELLKSDEDVRGVIQGFELYQGDGEYDLGDLAVFEFRTAEGIDDLLNQLRRSMEQRAQSRGGTHYSDGGAGDSRRLCRFRSGRVMMLLRLWSPDEEQFAAAVAPLQSVLGQPTAPLD